MEKSGWLMYQDGNTTVLSREQFLKLVNEAKVDKDKKKDVKHDSGCLMAFFDIDNWDERIEPILTEDLYLPEENPEKYGAESEPHVTVLYGFKDDELQVQDIIDKVQSYNGPVSIKITGISLFENEKFDVVKYEIESEQLKELNTYFVDNFPNSNEYPEYKAHMTIAYVKPGMGKKYVKVFDEPEELFTNNFVYSMACGQKLKIKCSSFGIDQALIESTEDKHIEINIKATTSNMDHAQELCNMINYMNALAQIGSSNSFKVWADGDGRFRTKFEITSNSNDVDVTSKDLDIDKDEKIEFSFD